jgi:hypothetical protein
MPTTHTAARWSSELEIAKRAMWTINSEETFPLYENSVEIKLRLLEYTYRDIHMIDTVKGVSGLDDRASPRLLAKQQL